MKKLIPLLIITALIVLAVIAPWQNIKDLIMRTAGISHSSQASISITSKVGQAKVFLNEKDYGETPFEKNDLKPGKYKIRLEKVSNQVDFYNTFERTIEVEKGTQVVIDWEIGPSEEFSSGEIYFFKERLTTTEANSTVSIMSYPEDANIHFDGARQVGTPIVINDVKEGGHKIKTSKDGYIEEELDVVCKSGYDLFVEVRLFPVPVDIK